MKFYLDFTDRIRYNNFVILPCRCVGMADEGDSKSLVRITRVGSTPTTGIKNSFKLQLGAVFYFAGVRGQTEPVIHTSSTNAFI